MDRVKVLMMLYEYLEVVKSAFERSKSGTDIRSESFRKMLEIQEVIEYVKKLP